MEENAALTLLLESAIAKVYSLDPTPPACPRCGSHQTQFDGMRPKGSKALPTFACRGCARRFSRLVGTPLARLTRKDALPGFIRLLSQQRPIADAVNLLSLDENVVRQWVSRFRCWLMQLDPSGAHESMVKLGLKPPSPVLFCPHCEAPREVLLHGYASGTSHLPYVQRPRQFRCKNCRGFLRLLPAAQNGG